VSIQRLQISGFRSLKDISWTPGPLNVVIGPNGSGKSNLLRALALLRDSALGTLGQTVLDQGGIAPLLWDGRAKSISWKVDIDPLDRDLDPQKKSLTYELELQRLGLTSSYRVQRELLANYYLQKVGKKAEPMKFLERDGHHAVAFDTQQKRLVAHEGSVPDDQTLLSLVAGPFSNSVILQFRNRLSYWSIYHDLHVDQSAPVRQAAVARVEHRVAADGQNLVPVLHTLYTNNKAFKRTIDSAMRAAFEDQFEELIFPPAADQKIQLRVRWRSLETAQPAADLSDGTIRFLLLCTILAAPATSDLIAIDEPETGLHPSMFPIIAELAASAAEHSQIVLTTHSSELLSAFSDRVPTTTVAQVEDGETRLSVIAGERLTHWLKEYSLGALFRSGELEGAA
jgi:predicted ATPase